MFSGRCTRVKVSHTPRCSRPTTHSYRVYAASKGAQIIPRSQDGWRLFRIVGDPNIGAVVAGLDTSVRPIVNECLPSDHFDITEFDEAASVASTAHVDLVIFCAPKDLEKTQALCGTLRSHVSQSVPLLCCAGRYVYPLIRELLGNTVQSMVIMPIDARELRQKLDELDLGF